MWVDSHCHINYEGLVQDISGVMKRMSDAQVSHALCIGVSRPEWNSMMALIEGLPNIFGTIGVHPDSKDAEETSVEELLSWSSHPKVVGLGETGLDYYRTQGDMTWQHERFRTHIQAARLSGLPLVVHTRSSAQDTINLLKYEGEGRIHGVMHCFTESWDIAKQALDLGFYISISGIVTFKNALVVQEVATKIPLDRLLIETDAPFLAPVPFRGKINEPSYVVHVAKKIADLRSMPIEKIAQCTSDNFFQLFSKCTAS
jgi:TatD DNase family protein